MIGHGRLDRNPKQETSDDREVNYAENRNLYRCYSRAGFGATHGVGPHPGDGKLREQDRGGAEAEIRTNLSIFSAFRLPADCPHRPRPGLTPVNTFRLVFACLDKTQPRLLEDRMFAVYYLSWPSGGKVREWKPN